MMKYEVKGTYNELEAIEYKKEFVDEETENAYENAVNEDLFNYGERIPSNEEIDAVAKKFNVPYDVVDAEGWFWIDD